MLSNNAAGIKGVLQVLYLLFSLINGNVFLMAGLGAYRLKGLQFEAL